MEAKEKLRKRAIERKRQMDLEEKRTKSLETRLRRGSLPWQGARGKESKIEELDAETRKRKGPAKGCREVQGHRLRNTRIRNRRPEGPTPGNQGSGPFYRGEAECTWHLHIRADLQNELRPGGHNKRGDRVLPRSDKRDEWAKQARAMVTKKIQKRDLSRS